MPKGNRLHQSSPLSRPGRPRLTDWEIHHVVRGKNSAVDVGEGELQRALSETGIPVGKEIVELQASAGNLFDSPCPTAVPLIAADHLASIARAECHERLLIDRVDEVVDGAVAHREVRSAGMGAPVVQEVDAVAQVARVSQAPNEVTGFAVYREPMRAKWIAVCGELAGGACGECSADSKMNIVA